MSVRFSGYPVSLYHACSTSSPTPYSRFAVRYVHGFCLMLPSDTPISGHALALLASPFRPVTADLNVPVPLELQPVRHARHTLCTTRIAGSLRMPPIRGLWACIFPWLVRYRHLIFVPVSFFLVPDICPYHRLLQPHCTDTVSPRPELESHHIPHGKHVRYDQRRTEYLMKKGYHVARFWNNDVLLKTGKCARRILARLVG